MTSRTIWTLLAGLLLTGALGTAAAFYSGAVGPGNSTVAGSCAAAAARAQAMAPLVGGEVAAVAGRRRPVAAPALAVAGPDGKPTSLAAFRGRTVLVNLWATWCPPCLKEMPSLDQLQAELGGADFAVVAVNIDTRNLDKPRRWLKENGIERLTYYGDQSAGVFQSLRKAHKVEGMPVSLIVDREGCELAILQGPAEWSSDDAKALIRAAMEK